MDFSFSPDQEELRALANRVLTDRCTLEHLKEIEQGEGVDLALWRELADLGLVGIGIDEAHGGDGMGYAEVAIVLEEIGRAVAQVPAVPVMGMVAPFLSVHAPNHLDGLASAERIITVAIHEPTGSIYTPAIAGGNTISGVKVCVPFGTVADAFLVTTTDGVYLVDAKASGVTVERQDATDGIPDGKVTFNNAPAEKIAGSESIDRLIQLGLTAQSVVMTGVTAKAIEIMAEYVKERVQFDRPIATFQAVAQRAADARIDSEAIRLTAWQAVMRIDAGLDAGEHASSAKYWAAEGGQRVVRGATHLHGGVGVDRDYPLHRYYLWAKKQELFLGGTSESLIHLGRLLADTPVSA